MWVDAETTNETMIHTAMYEERDTYTTISERTISPR